MNTNSSELDRLRDLLPAYGMGLTDAEDTAWVETVLGKYPEVEAELADYMSMSESMLYSAPLHAPSDDLHDRLMASIAKPTVMSETALFAPSNNGIPPRREVIKPAPLDPIIKPRFRWAVPALAAVVAILVVMNVFMLTQIMDLQQEQDQLTGNSDATVGLISRLVNDDVSEFNLVDMRNQPQRVATGRMLCNPEDTVGYLYTENLPPLEDDEVYQVWVWNGSNRVSGGIIHPDEDGNAEFLVHTPQQMGNYRFVGISVEPKPGSEEPTSNYIVRGALYNW